MFYFWLAEKWGLPVRILLMITDSHELTEWIAYYKAVERIKAQPDEQSLAEQLKQIPSTVKSKKGKK